MKKHLLSSLVLALFALPAFAFAGGSASINDLLPGTTVGVGNSLTFSVIPVGFTNPIYQVVDSFGGGANNTDIDANGEFSWTPNNSEIGSHTITINIIDSQGDTASASQTVTVTAPEISVSAASPSATIQYGTPVTFTLTALGFLSPQYLVADSFGDSSVKFSDTNNGVFTWTPLYQDIGTHTLTATASDYLGHLATTSEQINVTGPFAVNIVSVSPNTTVSVGEPVSIIATTTGFTNPTYSVADAFTSTLGTSSLSIDQTGHTTWTPVYNDIGTHVITISAADSSGNAGSIHTSITVVAAGPTPYAPPVPAATTPVVGAATITTTSGTPTSPSTADYVFTKYLSVGSSNADVTALQKLLLELGFFTATPTGYFGSITMHAVESYQSAHSISAIGVVGPLTRASLNTGK
jgi:hypothetical protein